MVQHAPGRLFDSRRRGKLAAGGGVEERGVRHAVPQRVREAARGGVRLPFAVRGILQPEEKIRRMQNGFDYKLRAFEEIGLAREKRCVTLDFVRFERPAERFESEAPNEGLAA